MSTFNTYGKKTTTFGGGYSVWRSVDPNGKWQAGGQVTNLPAVGSVIAAGTPVALDTEAHTAKILNFFKIHTAVTTSDEVVKVVVADGLPRIKKGMFVGVPATTAAGTLTAITVGDVTIGDGFDSFAITANALGALAKDSLLVEAAASGSAKAPYCVPNALTFNDVYLEVGDTAATVACVHTGTVYDKRVPVMSDGVKAALTGIKFDKSF